MNKQTSLTKSSEIKKYITFTKAISYIYRDYDNKIKYYAQKVFPVINLQFI